MEQRRAAGGEGLRRDLFFSLFVLVCTFLFLHENPKYLTEIKVQETLSSKPPFFEEEIWWFPWKKKRSNPQLNLLSCSKKLPHQNHSSSSLSPARPSNPLEFLAFFLLRKEKEKKRKHPKKHVRTFFLFLFFFFFPLSSNLLTFSFSPAVLLMALTPKTLMLWVQRLTDGFPGLGNDIVNFNLSWQNGLGFCAIIVRYKPKLMSAPLPL